MSIRTFVRNHVLSRLPDALAQPIRRVHYARVLRARSEDRVPAARIFRELIRSGDTAIDIGAADLKLDDEVLADIHEIYRHHPIAY